MSDIKVKETQITKTTYECPICSKVHNSKEGAEKCVAKVPEDFKCECGDIVKVSGYFGGDYCSTFYTIVEKRYYEDPIHKKNPVYRFHGFKDSFRGSCIKEVFATREEARAQKKELKDFCKASEREFGDVKVNRETGRYEVTIW